MGNLKELVACCLTKTLRSALTWTKAVLLVVASLWFNSWAPPGTLGAGKGQHLFFFHPSSFPLLSTASSSVSPPPSSPLIPWLVGPPSGHSQKFLRDGSTHLQTLLRLPKWLGIPQVTAVPTARMWFSVFIEAKWALLIDVYVIGEHNKPDLWKTSGVSH